MTVALALALVALGQTRYLFELDAVPVGTVELFLDGTKYTYRSTHAYRRAKSVSADTFTLGAGKPVPEGYWLWRKPAAGCVEGIAELSNETGTLCADEVGVREVKGTTLKRAFTARYDAAGELEELKLGKSRFVRTDKPLVAGSPYERGFAIEGKGKGLALEPPLEGARAAQPKGTRTKPAPSDDSCLELAQQYVKEHPEAQLTLGVVVEKGRAYPHAWAGEVDPSAKKGKSTDVYLELPREQAGALYVELLEGRRKLVWK